MKKSASQTGQSGSAPKPGSAVKPRSAAKPSSAATIASPDPAAAPLPQSIVMAVRLMYAGAGVTAIGLVISVIAVATDLNRLRASHPHATLGTLHGYQHALITIAILSGLLEIAVWLVVARANRAGAKWARMVATVLLVLGTWNFVSHFLGRVTFGNIAYSAAIWLVGLAAVIFLWQRTSTEYYASRFVPRQAASQPAQGRSGRRRQ